MQDDDRTYQPIPAEFALPLGFLGLLAIGVLTVAAHGSIHADTVLALETVLVTGLALFADPPAVLPLAVIGWFTVAAFSHPPYGELHVRGTVGAAVLLASCAAAGAIAGALARGRHFKRTNPSIPSTVILDIVNSPRSGEPASGPTPPLVGSPSLQRVTPTRRRDSVEDRSALRLWLMRWSDLRPSSMRASGIGRIRICAAIAASIVALPALTALLAAFGTGLLLVDDVLLYLVVVVVTTMIGGFWPAVLTAVAAALLLNWYFTPPVHSWTVDAPQNLLALLLFVTIAVTMSSVVHLAARRHALAAQQAGEADTLLSLARTVLGGTDTPQAVLDHLSASLNLTAELQERSGSRWVRIAGTNDPALSGHPIWAGEDLRLYVYGDTAQVSERLLDGYAAQAASARERHRLRTQAGQAEALAEGNRMRNALLAAVSHDLRTPLASVKAAVSTLRQTDVSWTPADQAALLATIEDGTGRLDTLIANLLDMSRLQTGALQPFLRPTALDEVAPLLVAGLERGKRLRFDIPDALPLLATDPGLLERALANLAANALRYSPPGQPPTLSASAAGNKIIIEVIDHGPGIPLGQRAQAFKPFQQLGDQRTGTGVGLGLAVAKGFIEAVGGRISALSTPGGGLTMRIELPVVSSDLLASELIPR